MAAKPTIRVENVGKLFRQPPGGGEAVPIPGIDGQVVYGQWTALLGSNIVMKTTWKEELLVPHDRIAEMRFGSASWPPSGARPRA